MAIGDIRFDNGCSCENCTCGKNKQTEREYIYDESGFVVGSTGALKDALSPSIEVYFANTDLPAPENKISYKYAEDRIIDDFKTYINSTYGEHYMTDDQSLECFDAWIALGDSTPTFRNTALKYLWRYGKKNGSNKKDLLKTLHYVLMCLYVDHYKDK